LNTFTNPCIGIVVVGASGSSGSSGTSGTSVAVGGTSDVFTKFTSATTIGDTLYDVHEMPSDGTLSFGPASDTNPISYGQIAHAKNNISTQGDAQTSQIILKANVNPGSGTLQHPDASGSSQLYIPINGVIAFEIHIVVLEYIGGNNASFFKVEGAAKNIGGSPAIVGTTTTIIISEDTPGTHQIINVLTGGSGVSSYLKIEVKNNSTIGMPAKFVAYVRYTQTLF